jgi:hypothetical protein
MDIFYDASALQMKLLLDKIISGEVPSHQDFPIDVGVELERASGLRPRKEEKKRAAVSSGGENESRQPKQGRQQSKEVIECPWKAGLIPIKQSAFPVTVSPIALAPDDAATKALLGAEVVSLYKGNPCKHLLLGGKCSFSPSRCRFVHEPTREPSEAVMTGVLERIATRVKELVAQAKN